MVAPRIVVVAHNIRSAHNIGSIFRTADGFGVQHLYLTGYSPYPATERDTRLPHIAKRVSDEISKTALGAQNSVVFSHVQSPYMVIDSFKAHGYAIVGLEQNNDAINLPEFVVPPKIVLILGEEIHGIHSGIIKKCTALLEIPMTGQKESFNVSVAAGIALYALNHNHQTEPSA